MGKMDPPADTNFPYVAYGLFKPNELAYNQIKEFVEGVPKEISITGSLYVRDGLPLLKIGGTRIVKGYLIKFRKNSSKEAYVKISKFEPKEHYSWVEYKLNNDSVANLLNGKYPDKASVHLEKVEWNSYNDPLFNECFNVISEVIDIFAKDKFKSAHPDNFEWERLFKLQMGYLLLWTVIERFCSLAYGPNLRPEEKIDKLGKDKAFDDVLKGKLKREGDLLYDSRDPTKPPYKLNLRDSSESIKYYRQARHNLSHRGKATHRDGEIIRLSLIELFEIFKLFLDRIFYDLKKSQCPL